MSTFSGFREPKAPYLFRLLWPNRAKKIEGRRFAGLKNRRGIKSDGDIVTLNSTVEYYTNRENRETGTVAISELEAKSAKDDLLLKMFGLALFVVTFFLAVLCANWDEIRSVLFPLATTYRPGNVAFVAVLLASLYLLFFGWMYNNFTRMDHTWNNSVDSFFADGARAQMEAIRDCMREFKRFVKWRRFMRLTMWAAVIVIAIEIVLLAFSEEVGYLINMSLKWSNAERLFALGFLLLQSAWLAVYWWMWIYFTTYRDPTLQLCVMTNVMDRARVGTTYSNSRQ